MVLFGHIVSQSTLYDCLNSLDQTAIFAGLHSLKKKRQKLVYMGVAAIRNHPLVRSWRACFSPNDSPDPLIVTGVVVPL